LKFSIAKREVDILVIREPEGYIFPYEQEVIPDEFKRRKALRKLEVLINEAEYEKDWKNYVNWIDSIDPNQSMLKYKYAKKIIRDDAIRDKNLLAKVLNWVENRKMHKARNNGELARIRRNELFREFNSSILLFRLGRYTEAL